MTPAEKVLERATGVRRTGEGRWIFKSPNRTDRTASVSMRELPDGKVLLHDFGGDDVATVLCGLGLEMEDLFPDRLEPTPAPRRRSLIAPADALRIAAEEVALVAVAAANVSHGVQLTDADLQRVLAAAGRLRVIAEEVAS